MGSVLLARVSTSILQSMSLFDDPSSVCCFHFDKPPLLTKPPELPLLDDVADYGEIWIKYPLEANPLPLQYGHIFKVMVEFRTIVTDLGYRLFDPLRSKERISFQEAMEYHSKLQRWYESLPDPFTAQKLVLPIHFLLQ